MRRFTDAEVLREATWGPNNDSQEEEEFDPTDEQYDRWRAEQDLLGDEQ